MNKLLFLLSILVLFCSCTRTQTEEDAGSESVAPAITSFAGEPLAPKVLPGEVREKHKKNLAEAIELVDAYPDSLDLIIWHGRRLAYLGRYHEAIQVYTDGLEKHPDSYRLRRHRGHRYITTRQIDRALDDFGRAAALSENTPNATEPDGLPNRLNMPLGNDKFNIWYHFGLSYYLDGQFEQAAAAYKKCMTFSDNNDLLAATSYWSYMTAKRLGNEETAANLLEGISPEMEMVENDAYHQLLLLFKGAVSEEEILAQARDDEGRLNPTFAYGIGRWYVHQDRPEDATALFNNILEHPQWDAFGYIAAEAEVHVIGAQGSSSTSGNF